MIYEQIDSPFSEGQANLRRKISTFSFRKNDFEITEHFYLCEETQEEFTTSELDALNLNQVYNQYRDKYGLPFPDQIKRIRAKYDVSALKMAEILGLGVNSYRLTLGFKYDGGDYGNRSTSSTTNMQQKETKERCQVLEMAD